MVLPLKRSNVILCKQETLVKALYIKGMIYVQQSLYVHSSVHLSIHLFMNDLMKVSLVGG